jgi:hypothetical protein
VRFVRGDEELVTDVLLHCPVPVPGSDRHSLPPDSDGNCAGRGLHLPLIFGPHARWCPIREIDAPEWHRKSNSQPASLARRPPVATTVFRASPLKAGGT